MWIHKKRCTAETDGTVMNIQGKGSEGLTAVSYTHLDVYKRQEKDR